MARVCLVGQSGFQPIDFVFAAAVSTSLVAETHTNWQHCLSLGTPMQCNSFNAKNQTEHRPRPRKYPTKTPCMYIHNLRRMAPNVRHSISLPSFFFCLLTCSGWLYGMYRIRLKWTSAWVRVKYIALPTLPAFTYTIRCLPACLPGKRIYLCVIYKKYVKRKANQQSLENNYSV